MAATARVPVLMTEAEKASIVKRAKDAGLTTAEYMRRAARSFRPHEEDELLDGLLDQMMKATEMAERAIDDALEYVSASNRRIATMEAKGKLR